MKVKQSLHSPGQAFVQENEIPGFQDNRRIKMVRLSALSNGRLYPQEIFLVLISVRGCWKDYVNENSTDIIGNRNRDLQACSAVPQPTTASIVILNAVLSEKWFLFTYFSFVDQAFPSLNVSSERTICEKSIHSSFSLRYYSVRCSEDWVKAWKL